MALVRKHFCAFPLGLSLTNLEIQSKTLAEIVVKNSFKIRAKQTLRVCDKCYDFSLLLQLV